MKLFIFIVLLILALWYILYDKVKLYKVYIDKFGEEVVPIEKNAYNVTISFIGNEPITISLLEFLFTYKLTENYE